MVSDMDYTSEDVERTEGIEEVEEREEVEEAAEIIVDQLKILLDITKLWRKILRNEADIENLEDFAKPTTAPVLVTVEKTSRKRSGRSKKESSKTRKKRS